MINKFTGEYHFLSNFYLQPIHYFGMTFSCVESAFQAQKVLDIEERFKFTEFNPAQSKFHGKRIVNLRSDWESIKEFIMYDLCFIKFSDPVMKELLLSTGDEELIEGNTWKDTYWGMYKGKGENRLGKILMRIRNMIR